MEALTAPHRHQSNTAAAVASADTVAGHDADAPYRVAIPCESPAFDVVRCERVEELDVVATLYKHKKTGAELVSVRANDENKVFGVTFATPVDDSTGVPHVLEHSVLCGSRKYPVKEPFVELLKSSVQTFLNAFTYPDRTCYPVASPNETDFYNLVDVYLDAVFHPRLTPQVLQQEGWHFELGDSADGDAASGAAAASGSGSGSRSVPHLTYKGVVFNEMKGVFSSPDQLNHMLVQTSLFPDNTYVHCSGGDPRNITDLTFEQFKGFHERYYHPSNARLFFFGDDAEPRRLAVVDEYLSQFDARERAPEVAIQRRFSEPRRVVGRYPAAPSGATEDLIGYEDGEAEHVSHGVHEEALGAAVGGEADLEAEADDPEESGATGGKHMISTNWVLHEEPLELVEVFKLTVLDHLLMGTSASPLHHALTTSGLGERVIGGGMDGELRQNTYGVGLKGVAAEDVDLVEGVVLDTMSSLADEGFSREHIDASLNTLEFRLREFANSSGSPKGLSVMLASLTEWLYGGDPIDAMRFDDAMAQLRAAVDADPELFQKSLRTYFLDNTHRVTVHLVPDTDLAAEWEAGERARLAEQAAAMGSEDVDEVRRIAQELKARQQAPDDPEALALIPRLDIGDMARDVRVIPKEVQVVKAGSGAAATDATMLVHEQPTSGIAYVTLALEVSSNDVPERLLPLMPVFTGALGSLGTSTHDEVAMARRIGTHTGGVDASFSASPIMGGGCRTHLFVGGKALSHKVSHMGDIMRDMLLDANLDQRDRVLHFVREEVAAAESALIHSGHAVVGSWLGSQYSKAAWVAERTGGGPSFLGQMRALQARVESDWPSVLADLNALRAAIITSRAVSCNVTADARTLPGATDAVRDVVAALPGPTSSSSGSGTSDWSFERRPASSGSGGGRGLGLAVPTQVNYVGKAFPVFDEGALAPGSATIASAILRMGYLWELVRVQGGAYGGFCDLDAQTGLFAFLSYRDPNLLDTLDVYDGAAKFLANADEHLAEADVHNAIISTIGGLDAPMTPASKAATSFARHLSGITQEMLQLRREQMLATDVAAIRAFADVVDAVRVNGVVGAVASDDALRAANEARPGTFDVSHPMGP